MCTAVKLSLSMQISQGKDVVGKNDKVGPSIENIKGNVLEALALMYICCCSVAKLYPTLCDPMDCRMPDFPVLHHLPQFAQTHVHWVNDAIQPSHPLLSPSSPALNLSQQQGLFQRVSSSQSIGAKVLDLQLSASVLLVNIYSWFPLGLTGLMSLQSKGLSRVFSSITIQKHK